MKRLQAFKFELQPNGGQARSMRRFTGSCRFVFNKALALQQENHADLVGAINIFNRGTKMLEGQDTTDASVGCVSTARIACGEAAEVKRSVKQEPAERKTANPKGMAV